MSRQVKIAFVVGILAVMALVVWLLSGSETENKPGSPDRQPFVSANWSKRYQPEDKHPYGLYLFHEMTRAHVGAKHVRILDDWAAFDALVNDQKTPKTYLFIGNNFGLENRELDTLRKRIEEGSDLVISYNELTSNVYDSLIGRIAYFFDYAEGVNVFTDSASYRMLSIFQNDTVATEWKAFMIEDSTKYRTLSSFMEMGNFIRIPKGLGNLYLHANPLMFCNYQVKRPEGFQYAQYVLSYLPKDREVYVLEWARLTDNYGNYDVDEQEGGDGRAENSYLKEIFKSPALRAAMFLAIAGLILFVIFRSRRTRPVVPYISRKKNMTMAFAETITSIYFAKRNPYGLLQVQRKNFYATVQRHFFVDLNRREDDRPIQILAEKSNRRFEEIKGLLDGLESKEAFSVSDTFVAEMQKKIHAFYKSTGVITQDMRERAEARTLTIRRSMLLPVLLIPGGLFCIIYGTYYLMISIGAGITFWPVGILMLYQGIIRLVNPYMVITRDEIRVHLLPAGKRVYRREDLLTVEIQKRGVVMNFKEDKKQIINFWDMSSFDRKQFRQWLSGINTLKL